MSSKTQQWHDKHKLHLVEKMRLGKNGKRVNNTRIQYNSYIPLPGIPLAAYDAVVNCKPALEWVMERQSVTTDKDSGIVGIAEITDCVEPHRSKWFQGPYGWVMTNARPLPFKQCKGQLKFFSPKVL